jgi:hypothetical protein
VKVSICTPAYSDTKALYTVSLAAMLLWSSRQPNAPVFNFHLVTGAPVHIAREGLAEDALSESPDYLLWLDSDQTFPQDLFARLAAHDQPIVGCNYRRRNPIPMSSATRRIGRRQIPITPGVAGLEPVDVLGLGACLIKAEVFRQVPRPWFLFGMEGEDAYFFERAKAAGFQPYVDHALSVEVGHIAETVLTFPNSPPSAKDSPSQRETPDA